MTFLSAALVVLAVAFVCGLARVTLGPTVADRAVGADVCLFCVAGAMAVLAVELEAPVFLDAVLVATLLGFIATMSLAKLVGRGRR
jgi:multicomponent Na+:H+ antiporter subunit F